MPLTRMRHDGATARAVRGPKHVVKTGKTTVLDTDQARTLLDSISGVAER